MVTVEITQERLLELIKLADWQIRELGFNPDSITAAYLKLTDSN